MFKTKNRGWGLRALHDIPEGTFICKYIGRLYKSTHATEVICLCPINLENILFNRKDDNIHKPMINMSKYVKIIGGIPYTAHGAQITPPPLTFDFDLFFCFNAYYR